jgi:prepilin-type N-terminal cleavage/methylation domain-containing protein
MKQAFTLIEILSAIMIMGILMVISFQSVHYINSIHQQNELRYLALNRIDSEVSRLVMAYENYTYNNFATSGSPTKHFKSISGDPIIDSGKYGLKISNGQNFILLKDNTNSINTVDEGDFIGLLSWQEEKPISNNEVNLSISIEYPYIYHSDTDYPRLWDFIETVNIKTSTKVL